MSYILDALVKADYERQREMGRVAVPGLHTVHARPASPPAADSASRVRYATGVGLAGLLLAAAWHFWPAAPVQPDRKTAPAIALPDGKSPPAVPAMAPGAPYRPAVIAAAPPAPPATPASPSSRAQPAAAEASAASSPEREARPVSAPRVQNATRSATSVRVVTAAPVEPGASGRAPMLGELPPAVQKEVQKITVSGFSNANDPETKMAIINDRAVREGELLAGGVRVESIAADAVVFGYKGYRFRVGAH